MLYKILNKDIFFYNLYYNFKRYDFLNKLIKKKLYYSFFFFIKKFHFYGFAKKKKFFNKNKIIYSETFKSFCFFSYEFFYKKLQYKRNIYNYINFFNILPNFFMVLNNKKNIFSIILIGKNYKKIFIKFKKILKKINNKKYYFNFYIKYKKKKYQNYITVFNNIKKLIKNGDLMQIQLSKKIILKTNVNLIYFLKLIKNSINNKMFYLNLIKNEILSFSPEILLKKYKKKIKSFPIAGTIVRGKNFIYDIFFEFKLINDTKEKSEHLMLIDLNRNDFNKISILGKTHVVKNFFIKKYFFLQHIVSKIVSKIKKKKNIYDILSSVHPAGTLSGTPKVKAIKTINLLEKNGRNIYGGCFGCYFNNNFNFKIIIRSCVYYRNYIFLQSASGIVNKSILKYEWKELNNKLKIFYFKK
ncbi:chorismate-binding protein [Candidatus Vidania fulgoroideorum]